MCKKRENRLLNIIVLKCRLTHVKTHFSAGIRASFLYPWWRAYAIAQLRRRALNDPSFPSFSRAVYFDLSACGKVFEAKLLNLRANFVFFLWPGKIVVTGSEIAPTGQWTLYSCSKRSKGSPNRREEVERQTTLVVFLQSQKIRLGEKDLKWRRRSFFCLLEMLAFKFLMGF